MRLSTGSGKQNHDQRALNVLNIQAGRQQQPVIESTMASWGGAGRCYPWLEFIYIWSRELATLVGNADNAVS